MEKEMKALQRDLKLVEESHVNQVLNLVLARGYLSKLIANSRIARYRRRATRARESNKAVSIEVQVTRFLRKPGTSQKGYSAPTPWDPKR